MIIDINAPFSADTRGKSKVLEQMQSQEDTTQETTSSVVDARTEATEAVATENEVQDVDEQLQKQKETEKIMAKKALQNANPNPRS